MGASEGKRTGWYDVSDEPPSETSATRADRYEKTLRWIRDLLAKDPNYTGATHSIDIALGTGAR